MKRAQLIIVAVVNLIFVLALSITNTIAYIPPYSALSIFNALGLFFIPLVLINLIFIIFWLSQAWWKFMTLGIVSVLLSIPNLQKTISFSPELQTRVEDHSLSIVSYNVHYFNFFEKENEICKGDEILNYLSALNPDIICIQEFAYFKNGKYQLNYIRKKLKDYPYVHIEVLSKTDRFVKGIATFSKYKISKKQRIELGSRYQSSIQTSVKINKKSTLQVFNCYLESNKLSDKDKEIYHLRNYNKNNYQDKLKQSFSRIYHKLGHASFKRGLQAEKIAQQVSLSKSSPYIICGDLNDLPISYTYQTICGNNTDTFLALRKGFGDTFHEKIYNFRIDYIFTNEKITPLAFSIENQDLSDHKPIQLNFIIN